MRRYFALTALVVMAAIALAQAPAKPKAPQRAAGSLPTRATVDSFLRHMFGYDPSISWTIEAIKPSEAPGISEVDLNLKATKNSGERKIFVLPGQHDAVAGNLVAFPGDNAARPPDAAINNFVRQMTGGTNPSITWSIEQVKPHAVAGLAEVAVVVTTPQGQGPVVFLVTPEGKHALIGEVVPFGADPFAAARAKLRTGMNGPARGPANAPVTIVEFADLQCPACKAALPEVQKLIADEPNARFVFQQFPLVQVHHWALKAAEYGDCIYRQNAPAFWKFADQVYGAQEQITSQTNNTDDAGTKAEAKLKELATASGADAQAVAACANQPDTAERVNQSVALGKELGVTGTPTLFVGGRKINNLGAMSHEQLKRLVDAAAGKK